MKRHIIYKLNKIMTAFRPDEVRECFEELEKIGNELSAANWQNGDINEGEIDLSLAFGDDKASRAFFGFELLENELIKTLQKATQADDFLVSKRLTPQEYVLLLIAECVEKNLANNGIALRKNLKKLYFRGEISENLRCLQEYVKDEIFKLHEIRNLDSKLDQRLADEVEEPIAEAVTVVEIPTVSAESEDVSEDVDDTEDTEPIVEFVHNEIEETDEENSKLPVVEASAENISDAETAVISPAEPMESLEEAVEDETAETASEVSETPEEIKPSIAFKFLEIAKAEIKKTNIRRPIDAQSFFDALLAITIKYSSDERRSFLKSKNVENVYRSDRALFELMCFVIYLVDMWICFNQEEMRKGFMRKLYMAYLAMLTGVFELGEKELLQIIFDRQAYYQELEHEREMQRDDTLEALANLMALGVRENQFIFTDEVYATPKTERVRVLEPLKLWYVHAAADVLELLEKYFDQ